MYGVIIGLSVSVVGLLIVVMKQGCRIVDLEAEAARAARSEDHKTYVLRAALSDWRRFYDRTKVAKTLASVKTDARYTNQYLSIFKTECELD